MALVHHEQKILGEVVQQGGGGGPRRTAGQYCRVVLDALAHAHFLQHFHVVVGALGNALGFQQLALLGEFFHLLVQLLGNLGKACFHLLRADDVVAGGEDGHVAHHVLALAGEGAHLADAVDLVPEKLHPDGQVVHVGQVDVHNVPVDPELVAGEVDVIALVLEFHQTAAEFVPAHLHAGAQADDHAPVIDRVAQRVDAGDTGHNDDVAPLGQGRRGRVPQPVDLVVDGAVLFNIGIGGGNIGLRLVVVVVGDKVFHRVVGEKTAHLGADLAGQGLVGLQDQGGAVAPGNDVRHGEGLARTGHAQKGLCLVPLADALHQGVDGLGLVAGGGEGGLQMKNRRLFHEKLLCLLMQPELLAKRQAYRTPPEWKIRPGGARKD